MMPTFYPVMVKRLQKKYTEPHTVVCKHPQLLKGLREKDLMHLGVGKAARAIQQDPYTHTHVHTYTHIQAIYMHRHLWSIYMWQMLTISKSK